MIIRINGISLPPQAFEQTVGALKVQDHTKTQAEIEELAVKQLVEHHIIRTEANDVFAEISDAELNQALANLKDSHGGEELFHKNFNLTNKDDENVKKDLNQQIKIDRFLNDLTKMVPPPSNEMVQQYYDKHPGANKTQEERHILNIVHKFEPKDMKKTFYKMMGARKRVLAGEDFMTVANEIATCDNPDLGFFPRGKMVEEFDTVAFSLEKDEISPIVMTQFGYHIIKCVGINAEAKLTFDKVKDSVKAMLHNDLKNKHVEQWLEKQKSKADIQVMQ